MLAKQKHTKKDKPKFCMNRKRKNHNTPECWEEGSGNHANTPHWVKKDANNTNEDKKKRKGTKAPVAKEDSGSKSAAAACGLFEHETLMTRECQSPGTT